MSCLFFLLDKLPIDYLPRTTAQWFIYLNVVLANFVAADQKSRWFVPIFSKQNYVQDAATQQMKTF